MLELHYQILLAFCLDILIGDPPGYPHPVRLIGRLANYLENVTQKLVSNQKTAGVITACVVVGTTLLAVYALLYGLEFIHPVAHTVGSVFFLYTAFSMRCLFDESKPVLDHLRLGQEESARLSLSRIVGRDTTRMDKPSMIRATIETIAEGTVDGFIAPLFYAILGGPPLALAYKAVNTMDSMFGYKNDKYLQFGCFPARLDDVANWVPARLAGPIIALSSFLCGLNGKTAMATVLRDGQNHLSPNAGIPEAAVAGALGIQLGGTSLYGGQIVEKPFIGDSTKSIEQDDIARSHRIMFVSSFLAVILFLSSGLVAGLF